MISLFNFSVTYHFTGWFSINSPISLRLFIYIFFAAALKDDFNIILFISTSSCCFDYNWLYFFNIFNNIFILPSSKIDMIAKYFIICQDKKRKSIINSMDNKFAQSKLLHKHVFFKYWLNWCLHQFKLHTWQKVFANWMDSYEKKFK